LLLTSPAGLLRSATKLHTRTCPHLSAPLSVLDSSMQLLSGSSAPARAGRKFAEESLASLCEHGAKIVRLDAFGYATKKPGTRCFFEVRSDPEFQGLTKCSFVSMSLMIDFSRKTAGKLLAKSSAACAAHVCRQVRFQQLVC
jgi:hypothetical protein